MENSNELIVQTAQEVEKMQKVQEVDFETGEVVDSPLSQNALTINVNTMINATSLLDKLSEMEVVAISPKYAKMKEGDVTRGIFLGYNTTYALDPNTKVVKPVRTAMWVNAQKEIFQHGGVTLMSALNELKVLRNTPIQITCNGKKGNTFLFDVAILGTTKNE